MHSSYMFARRRKEEIVRDNMGHANIDVTQNVYWRVACPSKLLACGRRERVPRPCALV
jgi:integrase